MLFLLHSFPREVVDLGFILSEVKSQGQSQFRLFKSMLFELNFAI